MHKGCASLTHAQCLNHKSCGLCINGNQKSCTACTIIGPSDTVIDADPYNDILKVATHTKDDGNFIKGDHTCKIWRYNQAQAWGGPSPHKDKNNKAAQTSRQNNKKESKVQ